MVIARSRYAFSAVLAVVAFLSGGVANAATMTLSPDDIQVLNPGNGHGVAASDFGDVNDYGARIGEYFYPGGAVYVMPFQLPTLNPGEGFTTADLRMQLFEKGGTPPDADLTFLRVNASSAVLAGDYGASGTLIQASYLTASTPLRIDPNNGFVSTDATGDAALAAALNTAYAGGANAGQYVFLRLATQSIPNGNIYYTLLTKNAGGSNEQPLLSYEAGAVPEPASLGLAGVAAIGLLARRRKVSVK